MPVLPRSGAVLIGVSEFDDPAFRPVPAALNSLKGMRRILTDPDLCGWSKDLVTVIPDPVNAGRTAVDLRNHVRRIEDVLLVYYVGHGQLTETGALCLAVKDTIADGAEFTGLGYAWLSAILRDSPARVKITILDCCFSGQALQSLAATDNAIADLAHVHGVYTVTATTSNETAHVVRLEEQKRHPTSFTGQLIQLVEEGIPDRAPELTIHDIYPVLRQRLVDRGLPQPDQRGSDTVFHYVFTRNAAVAERRGRKRSKGAPAIPTPEPEPALALPASLAARFAVTSVVSARRASTVVVADETATGLTRVLKVVGASRSPRRRVAEQVAELSRARDGGQHLITFHEIGEEDNTWYEVQEYCFHQSLRAVLQTAHRLDPAAVAREVCRAVAFFEERGLLVVDLRPEGILVRSLKPLDLVVGDIRYMRSSPQWPETVGARARPSYFPYLPPEASQNMLEPAWDWWSAGMVIAEVALGRHPFAKPDGTIPAERQLVDRARYDGIDFDGIADRRVRALCEGLLMRDRRQRWGRAKVLRWIAGA